MFVLVWILLGLIAGFIASHIVNRHGDGLVVDILLGVLGSVLGGWLFHAIGLPGVTGFNLYSLLVAVIGAVVLIALYHLVIRRRA